MLDLTEFYLYIYININTVFVLSPEVLISFSHLNIFVVFHQLAVILCISKSELKSEISSNFLQVLVEKLGIISCSYHNLHADIISGPPQKLSALTEE